MWIECITREICLLVFNLSLLSLLKIILFFFCDILIYHLLWWKCFCFMEIPQYWWKRNVTEAYKEWNLSHIPFVQTLWIICSFTSKYRICITIANLTWWWDYHGVELWCFLCYMSICLSDNLTGLSPSAWSLNLSLWIPTLICCTLKILHFHCFFEQLCMSSNVIS